MFQEQVIQWLRESDQPRAAALLSKCDLRFEFANLLTDGFRDYDQFDVIIAAPADILNHIYDKYNDERSYIEKAIEALARAENTIIRRIVWVPRVSGIKSPVEKEVEELLASLNVEQVQRTWEKALERRRTDPEGAITLARTLVETVCKCILDEMGVPYPKTAKLNLLYRLVIKHLEIAPDSQAHDVLRQILGSCQNIVDGLAALRNEFGDAHGKGLSPSIPTPALAELSINLAGAMAKYLMSVFEASRPGK